MATLPSDAFTAGMMRAAVPASSDDVTPSPPFSKVAELLAIGGATTSPALRIVDLAVSVARLQAFANEAHEALIEVERRALAAGANNSRASKKLTDANAVQATRSRQRAVCALSLASALLVVAVRSVGTKATPKLTAPMTSGEDDCRAIIDHAVTSTMPLFDYLADEDTPAWQGYERLFGKTEAMLNAQDTAARSGYVPRAARGTSSVQMGAEVPTIDAAFSWAAREHVYSFAPRVAIPQSAEAFHKPAALGGGALLPSGTLSPSPPGTPSAGSGRRGGGADRPIATTAPAAFARPLPVDARSHPALSRPNELRFVIGTMNAVATVDVPDTPGSYVQPLLKLAATEKLTAPKHDQLCAALAAPGSDVCTALADGKLRAALGAAWDPAQLLDHNKDVFLALTSACFRHGERHVLQALWRALCSSQPTEPACHVLKELTARHGIPAAVAPSETTTTTTAEAEGRTSPQPLPEADDPDTVSVPVDCGADNGGDEASGGGTGGGALILLRVGPASAYPKCLTSDLFGAAVGGMARALRNASAERRPRLLKLFSLVTRPLIKKREPALPLSASSAVSSLCLEHTDNKDVQALYQTLRQSLKLE